MRIKFFEKIIALCATLVVLSLPMSAAAQAATTPEIASDTSPVNKPDTRQQQQRQSKKSNPKVRIRATFGWSTHVWPANRFAPIRVTLSGSDRALGGMLVMRFQQDATQGAQLEIPASTTPGKATTYEFVAAVPDSCQSISFTLYSENNKRIASQRYTVNPMPRTLDMVPPLRDISVLLTAGHKSPDIASLRNNDSNENDLWKNMLPVSRALDTLPTVWSAYEGVAVVIIPSSAAATLDPVALDALRVWCSQGGTLVLLADGPGNEWTQWFDPSIQANPVEIAPIQEVALPGYLTAFGVALEDMPAAYRQHDENAKTETEITDSKNMEPSNRPRYRPLREHINARPISLTPSGIKHGWNMFYTFDTDNGLALAAEGPFGLGWIVVLGADPDRMPSAAVPEASHALWRAALGRAVSPWLDRHTQSPSWQYEYNSGGDSLESQAISSAFSNLDDVAIPVDILFTLIALGMVGLAIVVGPINAVVLKKLHKRHIAWLATLVWVALASLVAWVVPGKLHPAPVLMARSSVEDIILNENPNIQPLAWRSVTTALYANRTGKVRLHKVDPRGFWRGVSPLTYYQGESRNSTMLAVTQQAAGRAAWAQRGGVPDSLTQGIWSLHTALDIEPNASPLLATVERASDDTSSSITTTETTSTNNATRWRVTVQGLEQDADIIFALLRFPQGYYKITLEQSSDKTWAGQTASDIPLTKNELKHVFRIRNHSYNMRNNSLPKSSVFYGFDQLPGVWQRSRSSRVRQDSGHWATLYLMTNASTPDIVVDDPEAHYRTMRLIRMQIPITTELNTDNFPGNTP